MSNALLNVIVTGLSVVIMLGILLVIKKAVSQEPEPVAVPVNAAAKAVKKAEPVKNIAAKPHSSSNKKKTSNNKKKKKR